MSLGHRISEQWRHMPGRLARLWRPQARPLRAGRPLVSFTFDDVPRSAVTVGARELARRGWRGTFFLSGGLEGTRADGQRMFGREELHELAEGGQEIGCHSFSHARLPDLPAGAIEDEIARNRDWLGQVLARPPAPVFAYPYGAACPRSKTVIARRFPLARGIAGGVNAGWTDFGQLKVFQLERRTFSLDGLRRAIAEAKARNGWLVFFGHDLQPSPTPYGETAENFARVLDAVEEAGIEVLPLTGAAAAARG